MAIGTRRKGTFVRFCVHIPTALLDRVESFYTAPGLKGKRIYGYRSQLFTQLLTEWVNKTETSFYGSGTRRHRSPAQTLVEFNIPQSLNDQIVQRAPAQNGPIYGFRSQLMTLLLNEWVTEQERKFLSLPAMPAPSQDSTLA